MRSHYVIPKPCFPEENRHAMFSLRQLPQTKKFKNTFLNPKYERYQIILLLTKHLPWITDPYKPGKEWGAEARRSDPSSCSVEFGTRCKSPWKSLTFARNIAKLGTSQECTNREIFIVLTQWPQQMMLFFIWKQEALGRVFLLKLKWLEFSHNNHYFPTNL